MGGGVEGKVGGCGGDCCTHSDSGVSSLILAQAEGEGEGKTLSRHLRKAMAVNSLHSTTEQN